MSLCRRCQEITSGDCGMHGPRLIQTSGLQPHDDTVRPPTLEQAHYALEAQRRRIVALEEEVRQLRAVLGLCYALGRTP